MLTGGQEDTFEKPSNPPAHSLSLKLHWPAKVTELENSCFWVHKKVLWFDVSVTHALGMDVGQTAEKLIHIHLRENKNYKHKYLYIKEKGNILISLNHCYFNKDWLMKLIYYSLICTLYIVLFSNSVIFTLTHSVKNN